MRLNSTRNWPKRRRRWSKKRKQTVRTTPPKNNREPLQSPGNLDCPMKAVFFNAGPTLLVTRLMLMALLAPVCLSAAQQADSRPALAADPRFDHGRQLVEQGRYSDAAGEFRELQ